MFFFAHGFVVRHTHARHMETCRLDWLKLVQWASRSAVTFQMCCRSYFRGFDYRNYIMKLSNVTLTSYVVTDFIFSPWFVVNFGPAFGFWLRGSWLYSWHFTGTYCLHDQVWNVGNASHFLRLPALRNKLDIKL
jgi:hypothetical protein